MQRSAPLLVLLSLAVAGCFAGDPVGPAPERMEWHAAPTVTATDRFCGDCHYGLEEFWTATWIPDAGGGPVGNWTLEVAPRYPEAPLHAVQVVEDGTTVLWESGRLEAQWTPAQVWTEIVEVPEGAGALFARVHGEPLESTGFAELQMVPTDYVTALALVAPDGTRHEAAGPEQDLKILTIPDPEPGAWALEASLLGGDAPAALGVAWIEVLAGDVVPVMQSVSGGRTWTFPANGTGAPPEVQVRVQPHHDHALFENADWDAYDSSPFLIGFAPAPGLAPASPAWNETDIEAIWGGAAEKVVLERSGSFLGAYVDEPGHNDPGFGSSYPAFGSLGDPVLPGTTEVRFEMTWTPPLELPGLGVKFSPAGTPYFFEPAGVERSAGRAVFEATVPPLWWEAPDQTLAWLSDEVTSYWDVAPFLADAAGPRVVAVDWALRMTLVRG